MVGGVAASAAVRTWPFRVFSFPSVPQRVLDWNDIYFHEDWLNGNWPSLEGITYHKNDPDIGKWIGLCRGDTQ